MYYMYFLYRILILSNLVYTKSQSNLEQNIYSQVKKIKKDSKTLKKSCFTKSIDESKAINNFNKSKKQLLYSLALYKKKKKAIMYAL